MYSQIRNLLERGDNMTKKKDGLHTSPKTAGVQNMSESYISKNKDKHADDGLMANIYDVYKQGTWARKEYKGLWEDDLLESSIMEYFKFCTERELKPAKAGLRLWLGISKSQYWEWETKPDKYGYKSNLLAQASDFMELQYIGRIESYPTGNIFLLKTSHQHIETSKMDVTTNGQALQSTEEVKDLVSKLGLDKQD